MLSKLSVKKPLLIVVMIIIVIALGVVSYLNTNVDLLPEMDLPYMVLVTVYPGASPDTIEKEVTNPIESAIAKVSGIQQMTSTSSEHYSMVVLELTDNADMMKVKLDIQDKLKLVSFPNDSLFQDPIIIEADPSLLSLMTISMAVEGQSMEQSTKYLESVVEKLSAVEGVASANASGLVSDMAFMGLNALKTTTAFVNKLLKQFDMDLRLPDAQKENIREQLKAAVAEADSDESLSTDGKIDPAKVLDRVLERLREANAGGDNSNAQNAILDVLITELSNKNSNLRAAAIDAIRLVLDNRFMLEDGDENKKIFNDTVDGFFADLVVNFSSAYTKSMMELITADVLAQVIYAQDFDMPAGSVTKGATSIIVKLGDSIQNRDDFVNTPAVSIDIGAIAKDYVQRLQNILTLLSFAAEDGTVKLTDTNLNYIAEVLSWANEEVGNYAEWVIDQTVSANDYSPLYMSDTAKAQWKAVIEADADYQSLISGWESAKPIDWRTQLIKLVQDKKLYLNDDAVIMDAVLWDETYTTHYLERADNSKQNFSDGRPVRQEGETDEAYASALKQNAVNYVLNTASSYSVFTNALSEQNLADWRVLLNSDAGFGAFLNGLNEVSHIEKSALRYVIDNDLFPSDSPGWGARYTPYYKTSFESAIAAANLGRPSSVKGYSDWVVNQLANGVYGTEFYLNENFKTAWSEALAQNAEFSATVNSVSETDNWQLLLLNFVKDNSADENVLPAGKTVSPIKIWSSYQTVFSDALSANVTRFTAYENNLNSIKGQIGEEAYDMFVGFFSGRTKEQNYDLLVNLIGVLEDYGGEGAVVISKDETTQENVYAINFNVLKATLEEKTANVSVGLTLQDIADVIFINDASKQIATLMQKQNGNFIEGASVVISIEKNPDASSTDVAAAVQALLAKEADENKLFRFNVIANDGDTINFMMDSVIQNLLIGALLAAVILFIFLRRLKPTLIVSLSIVFSVVVTFVLMYFAGVTLNIISMCGLVLGVGMLVDNSIVVLENIQRLRLQGKSNFAASIQGAKQMSGAIFASTMTTIVVFLPIVFLDGLVKQIFTDMALTICFSLLASLFVALTLIPTSTAYFIKQKPAKETKVLKAVKKGYATALNFSLNNKWVGIILTVVMLAGTAYGVFATSKMEIFPETYLGLISVSFDVDTKAIDDKNLGLSVMDDNYYTYDDAVGDVVEQALEIFGNYNDINSVVIYQSGGMTVGGMTIGGGALAADINLVDVKKREMDPVELCKDLEDELNIKGDAFYTASVAMSSIISYATAFGGEDYTIRLFGDDYTVMNAESEALAHRLNGIEGVTYVKSDVETADEVYKLSVDKAEASKYGLTTAQIYLQVSKQLASVSSSHTLRLYENGSSQKTDTDVMIYSADYVNESWYDGKSKSGAETRIYFVNNTADADTGDTYYVKNKTGKALFVKGSDGTVKTVSSDGKIELERKGDTFTYQYALVDENTDGTHNVNYSKVEYSVSDFTKQYTVKRPEVDLISMQILSEDLLGTGAETVSVPLYKLLKDDSFVKDSDGNVLYKAGVTGEQIPAAIATSAGYTSIKHTDGRKQIKLTIGYDSSVKQSVIQQRVQDAVNAYIAEFNPSITVQTTEISGIMDDVFNDLYLILILGIALIYLIMVAQFQSWKKPFIVMFALPLAFTGSFLAMLITGTNLSAVALMGIIVLMGVAVNNGIVFVDYASQLIDSGVDKRTALIRTGIDRLRPILMTSLTTIFAMLVMAVDTSDYGRLLAPLAITMLGGLLYATVITLFIVPIMFDLLNKKTKPSKAALLLREANVDKVEEGNLFAMSDDNEIQLVDKLAKGKQFKLFRKKSVWFSNEAYKREDGEDCCCDVLDSGVNCETVEGISGVGAEACRAENDDADASVSVQSLDAGEANQAHRQGNVRYVRQIRARGARKKKQTRR